MTDEFATRQIVGGIGTYVFKSKKEAQPADDWEKRCAALYQVIGALASYAGVFCTDDVEAALNVACGHGDPENLLPWPKDLATFTKLELLTSELDRTLSEAAALATKK